MRTAEAQENKHTVCDRATVGAGSGHSRARCNFQVQLSRFGCGQCGAVAFRNGVNFTWDSRESWAQEGGSKARAEEPWPSARGAAGQHNADYGLVETLGSNLQGCEEAAHLTSFIPSCEQSFAVS